MNIIENWQAELKGIANEDKIKDLSRFFKTGKGEYGEGDVFAGIKVPDNRKVATKYGDASLEDIETMLHSEIHEYRLSALLALVSKYKKVKEDAEKEEIVYFYLANTKYINNWDLVDLSCPQIIGEYVKNRPADMLYELSESENLWEQRIAIVSTYTLIKNGRLDVTLDIAKKYLAHEHDLIQKASGWMLREVGKKNIETLYNFIDNNVKSMPRITLRYAIERMDKKKREIYMKKRNNA